MKQTKSGWDQTERRSAGRPCASVTWAVIGAAVISIEAETIVLPPIGEDVDGAGSKQMLSEDALRFQDVFNPELFSSDLPAGGWFNSLSLRIDRAAGPLSLTIGSLDVQLSTTGRRANDLSAVFSENLGEDARQVFYGESIDWSMVIPDSTVAFTAAVVFEEPFFYDPALGGLLVDVVIRNPSANIALDRHGAGQHAGRSDTLFHSSMPTPEVAFDPNITEAYVVRLGFDPVPEPGTVCFGGLALVIIAIRLAGKRVVRKKNT